MVATAVTLNDLENNSPDADVFTCNPSNICAAFHTITTDSVLARFLGISRASCRILHPLNFSGMDEHRIVKFSALFGPISISLVTTNCPQVGVVKVT